MASLILLFGSLFGVPGACGSAVAARGMLSSERSAHAKENVCFSLGIVYVCGRVFFVSTGDVWVTVVRITPRWNVLHFVLSLLPLSFVPANTLTLIYPWVGELQMGFQDVVFLPS